MIDEVSRILDEHSGGRAGLQNSEFDAVLDAEDFDEEAYLQLNPDVAAAVRSGEFRSGYYHYRMFGSREGRPIPGEPRNRLILSEDRAGARRARALRYGCDAVLTSSGGGLMAVGWIDDASDPVDSVRVNGSDWHVLIDRSRLVRMRRTDVEEALGSEGLYPYGFFCFLFFEHPLKASSLTEITINLSSGNPFKAEAPCRHVNDLELRNVALGYLASASFFGSPQVEAVASLNGSLGEEIVRFNRAITTRLVANPHIERFGDRGCKPRVSLLVCLYGKAEFHFVQNCLYAGLPGIDAYEFVFVSNSPELAETLLREARSSQLLYGLNQTIVILSGNAGFGGANNAGAHAALGKRLVALNPDVFPRDPDWASKHLELIETLPPDQTRLFGAPLYYDDGSLMHGGMYFELDGGISLANGQPRSCPLVRVEHYGKGAPAWAEQLIRSRPVPAVTGAFISVDRGWFERLEGFTEDYVFGHYEDADLCLKSLRQGAPAWLHDIKMWHLEGKGSTRLPPHEGGSVVNRWLFLKTWLPTLKAGLLGPIPAHPLLS
jgi:GT2 family glycosyltransferase